MRCYVLMGVSGCGKSSVGTALSALCAMEFLDGDDLHPKANIDKMACGRPLDEAKRGAARRDQFMPTALLDSQFAALERLSAGEWGGAIDIERLYAEVIAQSETYVRETLI